MPDHDSHYDETYYAWQRELGQFGAWADAPKFREYLNGQDRLIDFGCGGGFLLETLPASERIGIEVNPVARAAAISRGLDVRPSLDDVPDGWATAAISHHALEHCSYPMQILETLRLKMASGGTVVFVVPSESSKRSYDPSDHNRHLYTWSPLNIGHLFDEAGFEVVSSEEIAHRWPPGAQRIAKLGGRVAFDLASKVYARLRPSISQVRVVARARG